MSFWRKNRHHLWMAGVVTGILCLLLGAVNGQFFVIWKKAVMICMECIGIG